MYWAGFMESSLAKQFDANGFLKYPNFVEIVKQIAPFYATRAAGGAIYIAGVFIMIYNLWKTTRQGKFIGDEEAEAASLRSQELPAAKSYWHRILERHPARFAFITLLVILFGGLIELIPTFMIKSNIPTISSVKPYTPLELEGRDLYIREGCNTCHSQMIRPFRSETERYGEYSKAGEFVYDHPFLWGSKRTGPDLQREGTRPLTADWQYRHLVDPESITPYSIMPPFPWLAANALDTSYTRKKITVMRELGVPYPAGYELRAIGDLKNQEAGIAKKLNDAGVPVVGNEEIIALIAYLERLGTDIGKQNQDQTTEENQPSKNQ
jgi:cytochrome c oxidase cbb3-type subunit I/II